MAIEACGIKDGTNQLGASVSLDGLPMEATYSILEEVGTRAARG